MLIEEAIRVGCGRSEKTAVIRALEEYIAPPKQKHFLDLMSKLEWDSAFDDKAERSR
jgi:hypothetical protein